MKKLFCVLVWMLWVWPAAAQEFTPPTETLPSGPATIAGRVAPAQAAIAAADIEVVLYALQRGGPPGVAKTLTDAQGHFAFEKLSNSPDVTYLVGAQYQGVPFPGERIQFSDGQTRHEATISITEVRGLAGAKAPRILESTLQFERTPQHWTVTESHQLLNDNAFTIFSPLPNVPDAVLRMTLPANASGFAMPYGVIPEGVDQNDRQLAFRGPLYPGKQEFSFSYQIPLFEGDARVVRRFATPSQKLVVLLPPTGIELADATLTARGTQQVGPHSMRRFEGAALAAGADLVLKLNAPAARHDPQALQLDEVRLVASRDGIVLYCNEEYLFYVEGNEPIAGASDTPLFQTKLPTHASDIHFNEDSSDLGLSLAPDGALTLHGPVAPGEARLSISYSLPLATGAVDLARTFDSAIPIFSFYIEDNGILVESARLHRRRPVASEQSIYQRFEGFQLRAGEDVQIRLTPLSKPQPIARWIAPSTAFGVLALALVGLFLPLRARESVVPAATQPAPPKARQERELVYTAIRDLDEDYQTGKLEEALYRTSREELLARAAMLLEAERDQVAHTLGMSRDTQCPSCSTPISDNDRFCAQCGAKLHTTQDGAS